MPICTSAENQQAADKPKVYSLSKVASGCLCPGTYGEHYNLNLTYSLHVYVDIKYTECEFVCVRVCMCSICIYKYCFEKSQTYRGDARAVWYKEFCTLLFPTL